MIGRVESFMEFLFLCLLVFLVAIIVEFSSGTKGVDDDIKKKKERRRKKDDNRNHDRETISELVTEHQDALFQNWKRTIYVDEYGNAQHDDWSDEIDRFFESVGFSPKGLTLEASKKRVTKVMEKKAKQLGLEDFTK